MSGLHVEWRKGSGAISKGATGLSVLPSCHELIFGVTFELWQGNEALSRVDGDIRVFANGGLIPGVPLEFQRENGLLLRYNDNIGILCRRSRGMDLILRGGVENGAPLEL